MGAGKSKKYYIAIISIIVVIILGSLIIAETYLRSKEQLIAAHDDNLTDLAHSVDQNLDNLLTIYRQMLERTIKEQTFAEAENLLMEEGSDSGIRMVMRNNPLTKSDGVAGMLAVYQSHYKITAYGDRHKYVFPYKNYYENVWLSQDENNGSYLGIVVSSDNNPIRYVALIDLNTLYNYLVGKELRGGYSITFYDTTSRLLMYNDALEFKTMRIGPNDAAARNDGVSILVQSERADKETVDSYQLDNSSPGDSIYRISVLPTAVNKNGMFGIGVAVNYNKVYGALNQMLTRLLFCVFIIVSSLTILTFLIIRSERRARANAAQIKKLEKENIAMAQLVEKTEELAHHQRLELIGTMTSSIAHEINNMLTPVMGYSIMAMEKLPKNSDEIMDYLSEIYNSSSRAKQLILRLSSLSRKQSDHSFTMISPDELIMRVMTIASPSVPANVEVAKFLNVNDKCIEANEIQLQQAFLNIILNSFAAMQEQGGKLTIATTAVNDEVRISFEDTGCGIAPDILSRIYEPFFTTKPVGQGTGLGLAIVAQAIEDHKAKIEVSSELGKGTRFTVIFKKADSSEESEEE